MTLIELMIAISILTITIAIIYPKESIKKYEVESVTKQLCSDIRYTRKRNMLKDTSSYVYFKNENNVYSYIVRENGLNKKEVKLSEGIKIQYVRQQVIFRESGAPSYGGTTIKVIYKDVEKEITIVPVSGRVLLKEGKYET